MFKVPPGARTVIRTFKRFKSFKRCAPFKSFNHCARFKTLKANSRKKVQGFNFERTDTGSNRSSSSSRSIAFLRLRFAPLRTGARFIRGIGPFQTFKQFNRCAPFKTFQWFQSLRGSLRFKVQAHRAGQNCHRTPHSSENLIRLSLNDTKPKLAAGFDKMRVIGES